jgi:hypothetical protein
LRTLRDDFIKAPSLSGEGDGPEALVGEVEDEDGMAAKFLRRNKAEKENTLRDLDGEIKTLPLRIELI